MEGLIEQISNYGIYATLFLILLEYACLPISSEILLPLTGVIINRENESLIFVILLSVIFGILGSLICYLIGFFGSKTILKKFNFKDYEKYGSMASMICRLFPITRTYISFFQGIRRENIFRFIGYTAIGILIWNSVLISLGYFIGNNSLLINQIISKYKYFLIIIVIFILLKLIINYYKKK